MNATRLTSCQPRPGPRGRPRAAGAEPEVARAGPAFVVRPARHSARAVDTFRDRRAVVGQPTLGAGPDVRPADAVVAHLAAAALVVSLAALRAERVHADPVARARRVVHALARRAEVVGAEPVDARLAVRALVGPVAFEGAEPVRALLAVAAVVVDEAEVLRHAADAPDARLTRLAVRAGGAHDRVSVRRRVDAAPVVAHLVVAALVVGVAEGAALPAQAVSPCVAVAVDLADHVGDTDAILAPLSLAAMSGDRTCANRLAAGTRQAHEVIDALAAGGTSVAELAELAERRFVAAIGASAGAGIFSRRAGIVACGSCIVSRASGIVATTGAWASARVVATTGAWASVRISFVTRATVVAARVGGRTIGLGRRIGPADQPGVGRSGPRVAARPVASVPIGRRLRHVQRIERVRLLADAETAPAETARAFHVEGASVHAHAVVSAEGVGSAFVVLGAPRFADAFFATDAALALGAVVAAPAGHAGPADADLGVGAGVIDDTRRLAIPGAAADLVQETIPVVDARSIGDALPLDAESAVALGAVVARRRHANARVRETVVSQCAALPVGALDIFGAPDAAAPTDTERAVVAGLVGVARIEDVDGGGVIAAVSGAAACSASVASGAPRADEERQDRDLANGSVVRVRVKHHGDLRRRPASGTVFHGLRDAGRARVFRSSSTPAPRNVLGGGVDSAAAGSEHAVPSYRRLPSLHA